MMNTQDKRLGVKEKAYKLSVVEINMFLNMYKESTDNYIVEHRKKYGIKTQFKFQTMLDEAKKKVNSNLNVYME